MKSYVSQADPDPPRFFLWMWTKLTIYKKNYIFYKQLSGFYKKLPIVIYKKLNASK